MNKIVAIISFGIAFCGCVTPEQTAYTQDDMDKILWFVDFPCEETGITLHARVLVPDVIGKQKYPMVMFLHGAGQCGTDNKSQLYENDIGRLAYYSHMYNKHVIMVPQCPPDKQWMDEDMLETLELYVDYVARKVPIADNSNVTVTGFSMGGLGTYKLVMRNPEKYCGMMPICGGPKTWWEKERPDIPEEMKSISIWSFNNTDDGVVDNMYAKYIIAQMWSAENEDAHYSEQFNGHHDEYVFEDKKALDWLLTRKPRQD